MREASFSTFIDHFDILSVEWDKATKAILDCGFVMDTGSNELPPITLHGLRHTFASVASSAKVPMYQISRAMGHSSPATTQRVYTHLFDPTHGEVLAAVAAVITGKESV